MVDEIAEAAAQPVELPHDESVASLQLLQATGEGRAVNVSASHLVLEHGRAPGLLQRGKLHGRVLIFGADAGIAVFHSLFVRLTYQIRQPLFSLAKITVQ
jgi:hypothetical protein